MSSVNINPITEFPEDFDGDYLKKLWLGSFNLGEKRPLLIEWKDSKQVGIWQEPVPLTYFMGTDSYKKGDVESHSICVLRNDGVVEYINTFRNEPDYEREVARLSEYYKCEPIKQY